MPLKAFLDSFKENNFSVKLYHGLKFVACVVFLRFLKSYSPVGKGRPLDVLDGIKVVQVVF